MRDFKLKNNVTIEVTDEVFLVIRSSRYKERYAEKRDEKHQLIHYHAFDREDSVGENLIKDTRSLPDEIAIKNDMNSTLYNALATLPVEDQLLIYNLYVCDESLRSVAEKMHSNPMTVGRHRDKLILIHKYSTLSLLRYSHRELK